MKPRILQICPHDTAPFGVLCDSYRAAADLLQAEVVTVFLSPPDAEPRASATYLGVADLSDRRALRGGLKPLLHQRWDLILCHRYRAYRSALDSGAQPADMVVLAHEYDLLTRPVRRAHRALFARKVRFAGVAPEVARQLAAMTGRALVLPNALSVDDAVKALLPRQAARSALGLEGIEGPVVGVVGRLHYKKRPALALAAFESFAANHADARLVLLGAGDEALDLAGRNGVLTPGQVPDARRLFRAFDVLLHTASAEPFGMVVLEAMLAGVPVVVSPGHGPEYILGDLGHYAASDDAAGYAAALTDALTESLTESLNESESADRASRAARGLARARERFSIEALSRALAPLLQLDA